MRSRDDPPTAPSHNLELPAAAGAPERSHSNRRGNGSSSSGVQRGHRKPQLKREWQPPYPVLLRVARAVQGGRHLFADLEQYMPTAPRHHIRLALQALTRMGCVTSVRKGVPGQGFVFLYRCSHLPARVDPVEPEPVFVEPEPVVLDTLAAHWPHPVRIPADDMQGTRRVVRGG